MDINGAGARGWQTLVEVNKLERLRVGGCFAEAGRGYWRCYKLVEARLRAWFWVAKGGRGCLGCQLARADKSW
eukprot:1336750-Amorphochlora_amoeboformis.AAC.1